MATFEFLHLALSIPAIGPLDRLLPNTERIVPSESRQAYLSGLFGTRHDFFYKGTLFSFAPAPPDILPPWARAGFIGKQIQTLEPAGPDDLFALTPSKKWKAAFFAVDTRPSRQIIAFEKRGDVGSAENVISHLIESRLRERRSASWHVDIEYVTEKRGFTAAANRFRGQITELSFEFNPPNALRGFDKFKEFNRLAVAQTNSEKSEYSLKNKNGSVEPSGDFVDSAVDYASEGAGQVTMKAGKKIVFNSRNSKKTATIPESVMPREGEPTKIAGASNILLNDATNEDRDE
jgi:hypothetical protein